MKNYEKLTEEAVKDPRPGDTFQEMFSFWLEVKAVCEGFVIFQTSTKDEPECLKCEDYEKYLAYENIPGYWVTLNERGQ